MTELLTSAQMRAIEQAAIASGEVTGAELMERAGSGVVSAIFDQWWHLRQSPHRAVILCGPGNNGGDGYVIARLLHDLHWDVTVFALGDPTRLPPDALVNFHRWSELSAVTPLGLAGFDALTDRDGPADLYIDALFGTGITRPVTGEAWEVLTRLAGSGPHVPDRVVAVDAPSGLCLDSGRLLGTDGTYAWGQPRFADLTVAFDSPKLGHMLEHGPDLCGHLVVKDIGIHSWTEEGAWRGADHVPKASAWLIDRAPMLPGTRHGLSLAGPRLKKTGHKFSYGHALVMTGGAGRTGAARLSARAALRVGAGLVTLGVPGPAMPEVAGQITAVMMREINDDRALTAMLEDDRINALCIGPGLGLAQSSAAMVRAALQAKRPTVLDADALTLIAEDDSLRDLVHDACVMTPHEGEFKRLCLDLFGHWKALPKDQTGPTPSKVDAVRAAADRLGCTVLLKGPDTVIATPQGRTAIHAAAYARAAPWLATAGSGDVLAGLITGQMAMGQPPFEAACTGAWLHTEAALSFGPGLIAEDLPEEIPKVLAALENLG
jgi:hydroxyethylthiazole kinase-like uncharacterized protein yjeF